MLLSSMAGLFRWAHLLPFRQTPTLSSDHQPATSTQLQPSQDTQTFHRGPHASHLNGTPGCARPCTRREPPPRKRGAAGRRHAQHAGSGVRTARRPQASARAPGRRRVSSLTAGARAALTRPVGGARPGRRQVLAGDEPLDGSLVLRAPFGHGS